MIDYLKIAEVVCSGCGGDGWFYTIDWVDPDWKDPSSECSKCFGCGSVFEPVGIDFKQLKKVLNLKT